MIIYSLFEITQTLVGVAKIYISTSFFLSLSQFLCDTQMLLVIIYGLFEITQTLVGVAKIYISMSFFISLSQFFRNTQMLLVIIYGLIPKCGKLIKAKAVIR